MRGQVVLCKDFAGEAVRGIVWEDSKALIFIHSEDQFIARNNGRPFLEAVGFPVEDVFKYDHSSLKSQDPWLALEPYAEKGEGSPEGA